MKIKVLFSFLAMIFCVVGLNAQSLELTNIDDVVTGPPTEDYLVSHVTVTNTSEVTMNILITASPVTLTEGHKLFFCDMNSCWTDQTYEFTSPIPNTLGPGENMDGFFYLGLRTNGVEGTSVIFVEFYEGDVSVDYTATFNVTTTGVEVTWELADMYMYPNPAANEVTFDFNLSAAREGELEIYNEVGNIVIRQTLKNSGTQLINLNNFSSGSYFYRVVSGAKSTPMRRLTVSK